jgi:hypothetical protein
MADSEVTTPKSYFRTWWKAAWAPAYDVFGVLGVALGVCLGVWHKFRPENFRWTASQFGLSPEAAMSDLVWIIPLAFGLSVLAYRLIRAPFEIHVSNENRHQSEAASLKTQIQEFQRASEFNIDIRYSGYRAGAEKAVLVHVREGDAWVVFHDLVITNRSEKQAPLELWLLILTEDGMTADVQPAEWFCPDWVTERFSNQKKQLEGVLNVPGRSSVSGFCTARFSAESLMAGVSSPEELVEARRFWLQVRNNITGETRSREITDAARRGDRELPV